MRLRSLSIPLRRNKNRAEALAAIEKMDRDWYDDHAVRYRDDRKIFWLVKVEYHT